MPVSSMTREERKAATAQFIKTHRYDEAKQTWVDK
jgi:hypothetical protein